MAKRVGGGRASRRCDAKTDDRSKQEGMQLRVDRADAP